MRRKYRVICCMIVSAILVLTICRRVQAQDDDDYLIQYPDGSYGIDLGGGFETLPTDDARGRVGGRPFGAGELLLPEGYREDYKDTQYGAMTQRGFVTFPGFIFPDAKRKEDAAKKRLKEEEQEAKELIFHEDTTSAGSSIWGVSSPR